MKEEVKKAQSKECRQEGMTRLFSTNIISCKIETMQKQVEGEAAQKEEGKAEEEKAKPLKIMGGYIYVELLEIVKGQKPVILLAQRSLNGGLHYSGIIIPKLS